MLFNSGQYLVFLLVVVILYYLIDSKYRWALLLSASYYFYMCWQVEYVFLLVCSTLVDYLAGLKISASSNRKIRKRYLILSLVTNLGLLLTFKYFNFFGGVLNGIFIKCGMRMEIPALNLLLPIGISFYTFQSLSYTIDIYKGRRSAEKHLGRFALYVSFFPQLVAGPIERSTSLLPQFKEEKKFSYQGVSDGLKLILWGVFKKLVIADRAALLVDHIYDNPTDYSGFPLLLATYLFAFQLYCDFSAYTNIARGSARILGFELIENFRMPYLAENIKDFWKRWHISLTSWFRDYLYFPLGGSRVSTAKFIRNIMLVFLLSGLWHGANMTFIIWGLYHGILYLLWHFMQRSKTIKRISTSVYLKPLRIFFTFHLVCLGLIFFRAQSVTEALYIITGIFKGFSICWDDYWGLTAVNGAILGFMLLLLFITHILMTRHNIKSYLYKLPLMGRYLVYFTLLLMIIITGKFSNDEFIYFQF